MTAQELIKYLNDTYGIRSEWPQSLVVNAETYANCCQEIFNIRVVTLKSLCEDGAFSFPLFVTIPVGINNGLMFKGVELILR